MTNFKKALCITLLFPSILLAHGEQAILYAGIIGIAFFVVLISIIFTNWKIKGKFLLFTIYILSFILTGLCLDQLTFNQNMELIIFLSVSIPITALTIFYFSFKNRFEKNK